MEDDKWTSAQIPYDGKSRRAILGKVLELAVVKIFQSNVYKFAGKIYLQTDGAPIGLDLSGEIGRLVMAQYDVDFMEICESNMMASQGEPSLAKSWNLQSSKSSSQMSTSLEARHTCRPMEPLLA